LFREIRSYVAGFHEKVIATRQRILVAAFVSLLGVAACKYALVGIMLHEGMSRTELRLQDCLTAGLLAALVVWLALAAAHFRQKQIRDQVQTVADLNHHLRNALSIILNSAYLNAHDQKDAMLESVDRIERALQQIVPNVPTSSERARERARLLQRRAHTEPLKGEPRDEAASQ
jgi:hypothetical protein